MAAVVEDLVMASTIADQGGYTVEPAHTSNFVLSPNTFDQKVKNLADQLNVRAGLHSSMVESEVEKSALGRLLRPGLYTEGRYAWESPNGGEGEKLNEYLNSHNCPQRIRRAYIEAGLLTVRGGEDEKQDQIGKDRLEALGIDFIP